MKHFLLWWLLPFIIYLAMVTGYVWLFFGFDWIAPTLSSDFVQGIWYGMCHWGSSSEESIIFQRASVVGQIFKTFVATIIGLGLLFIPFLWFQGD
jgi:hypothetical protein